MVKSGETASIDVGTEVPIITSRQATAADLPTSGGDSSILQSIQYRKTGTLLDIEAVVHSGQRVDLRISQEVSEATPTDTSEISSPSILSRKLQTSLSLGRWPEHAAGWPDLQHQQRRQDQGAIAGRHPDSGTCVPEPYQERGQDRAAAADHPYVLEDATQGGRHLPRRAQPFRAVRRGWPGRPDNPAETGEVPVALPPETPPLQPVPGAPATGAQGGTPPPATGH